MAISKNLASHFFRQPLKDMVHECDISLSSDSSIKNAEPNDIEKILRTAKIKKIIANGKTTHNL